MMKRSRISPLLALLALTACSRSSESTSNAAATNAPLVVEQKPPTDTAQTAPSSDKPTPAVIPVSVQGSCSFMGVSCSDYQGSITPTAPKAMCEKYKGTWKDGPCAKANVQGICTKVESPFRVVTYSYPPGTPASAKLACRNTPGGVYSSP